MLMQGLAERLKATRELAGISARELGDVADLHPTYPSLIESGERAQVGADIVAKLARALGVTTDYLILGSGRPPSKRQVLAAIEAAREARGAA